MNGNHDGSARIGDDILLRPLVKTSARYFYFVLFFLALIGWGAYALVIQTREGLGVTGLTRPTFWGVYITNFVFFIGISHAGTLISAILRVTKAEWHRPITRSAEAITVFALCIGAPQVLIDLGRIDRIPNMFLNSRFQSPLLWDVCCIDLAGRSVVGGVDVSIAAFVGRLLHRHLSGGKYHLSVVAHDSRLGDLS